MSSRIKLFSTATRYWLMLIVVIYAGISACSAPLSLSCGMSNLFAGKYEANYSLTDTEQLKLDKSPLRKKVLAQAPLYRLTLASTEAKACGSLAISKQLFIKHKEDPRFIFTEINEYFDADGVIITKRTQDITKQISASGYYTSSDSLPIPDNAPAGKYKINSKLLLTLNNSKQAFLLAEANTDFTISR